MNPDAQLVLDFWFGAPGSPTHRSPRDEWFRKDAAFDALIAQRFGALIDMALSGGLWRWKPPSPDALALIVVLDQFTRNTSRDTSRAFAGDAMALSAATDMVAMKLDEALLPVQRLFVYLPYEHSELLEVQDESVHLFTKLVVTAPKLASLLDYAHRHHSVIARFGRFPHRNAALGRHSTAAELAFLQEPGSRF